MGVCGFGYPCHPDMALTLDVSAPTMQYGAHTVVPTAMTHYPAMDDKQQLSVTQVLLRGYCSPLALVIKCLSNVSLKGPNLPENLEAAPCSCLKK